MPAWIIVIFATASLPFLVAAALWEYMDATATPLHPNPQLVRSVARMDTAGKWATEVEAGQQIVRGELIEKNLPGLSVAVGIRGELVWAEGFGWADLDNEVAVTPDTRFRIGTASIPLTSAAVGLLLEQGRMKLDEQIQTYVPEFPETKWPVTLRLLMGHVAGVRNDGGDEGPLFSRHCERPIEALEDFKNSDLRFEPGTEYRHSSYGWILVSAAVEATSGKPFLAFMREQIFEPLGMDHTGADTEPLPDRAISYFPKFAGDPHYGPDPMREINLSCYAGSSVFVSTPSDLVRFGMAINGGKLLKPATVELLQTAQRLASGRETGYGLGWDLETVALAGEQTRWVGHEGMLLGGMASSLMTFRERGLVIAVVSNTSYANTEVLALKLAQAFAGPGR